MKKIRYTLIVVLAVLFVGCKPKEILTKEEVMAAIQAFDKGWKNKNPGSVDSILSPSYTYFTQSGGVFDRKNIVQTAGSADYQLQKYQRKQIDIKIEGNTAVVNTVWYGKGSYFGKPFDDTQRCSVTVIKREGKVLILAEHCTVVN